MQLLMHAWVVQPSKQVESATHSGLPWQSTSSSLQWPENAQLWQVEQSPELSQDAGQAPAGTLHLPEHSWQNRQSTYELYASTPPWCIIEQVLLQAWLPAGQALRQSMRSMQAWFPAQLDVSSEQKPLAAQAWQALQSAAASQAPAPAQAPLKHATLAGHTTPQAPQLAASLLMSTQSAPHLVVPAAQLAPQVPLEQS
jgi:hypothetical protein